MITVEYTISDWLLGADGLRLCLSAVLYATCRDAPTRVMHTLATKPATVNLHHWGVAPGAFVPGPSNPNNALAQFFTPLATNTDVNGSEFVSLIEGRELPVYVRLFSPSRQLSVLQHMWHTCIYGWKLLMASTADAGRSISSREATI